MWLIAGLGNHGKSYAGNRHNIGFMAVERIARAYNFGPFQKKFNGVVADGTIAGARALLLMPHTYMNLSGQSVSAALRFYKIEPDKLIVLHDELDLPLGRLRVKTGGGHGGHNGLKSIDADLGTQNYRRVRLGIGHPGDKDLVSPHVLSDFTKAEQPVVGDILTAVAKEIPALLNGDDAGFTTRIALMLGDKPV
jgi:PTH1 family peptidyl-tRNA hydrolase